MKEKVEVRYVIGLSKDLGSMVDADEEVTDADMFNILVILKEGGYTVRYPGEHLVRLYDHNEKFVMDINRTDYEYLLPYLKRAVYQYGTKVLNPMVYLYKVWI